MRLAVLLSGEGSNLGSIMRAIKSGGLRAELAVVISNVADAGGLARARAAGVAALAVEQGGYACRRDFERALADAIDSHGADLVVLAGFMRILGADFLAHFCGRILNIHPSLLPDYKGLDTHKRVLEAGELRHGATVHWVTEELDGGPIIAQSALNIRPGDTEDSLRQRVQQLEHRLYPAVLAEICNRRPAASR